ncbi:MAG TPA: Gmad2 immunoglobulin-like domain-containing protein [Candidatus Paceibacterota bacterium]|nr:Gmad2 immunoglobulin-like domain-containing protein [Candidatus Paceibacterota bacterium]
MNRNTLIILIIVLLIVVVGAFLLVKNQKSNSDLVGSNATSTNGVSNFYECAAAGFPTTESYPRECQVPNGPAYIEDLIPNGPTASSSPSAMSYKDVVKVTNLKENDTIKSPLTLKGEARGSWFFEGTFPVQILDSNKDVIGQGVAQAIGEWASPDYVPFSVTLTFKNNSPIRSGTLVLKKDNPSGDPSRDDSWSIPVRFAE